MTRPLILLMDLLPEENQYMQKLFQAALGSSALIATFDDTAAAADLLRTCRVDFIIGPEKPLTRLHQALPAEVNAAVVWETGSQSILLNPFTERALLAKGELRKWVSQWRKGRRMPTAMTAEPQDFRSYESLSLS